MELSDIDGNVEDPSNNYGPAKRPIVQFLLYKVGNNKVEKKYKERLKQLKLKHTAIAAISFSFLELESKDVCKELVEIVNQEILQNEAEAESYEEDQKKCLTNVPYYDIIGSSTAPKDKP